MSDSRFTVAVILSGADIPDAEISKMAAGYLKVQTPEGKFLLIIYWNKILYLEDIKLSARFKVLYFTIRNTNILTNILGITKFSYCITAIPEIFYQIYEFCESLNVGTTQEEDKEDEDEENNDSPKFTAIADPYNYKCQILFYLQFAALNEEALKLFRMRIQFEDEEQESLIDKAVISLDSKYILYKMVPKLRFKEKISAKDFNPIVQIMECYQKSQPDAKPMISATKYNNSVEIFVYFEDFSYQHLERACYHIGNNIVYFVPMHNNEDKKRIFLLKSAITNFSDIFDSLYSYCNFKVLSIEENGTFLCVTISASQDDYRAYYRKMADFRGNDVDSICSDTKNDANKDRKINPIVSFIRDNNYNNPEFDLQEFNFLKFPPGKHEVLFRMLKKFGLISISEYDQKIKGYRCFSSLYDFRKIVENFPSNVVEVRSNTPKG